MTIYAGCKILEPLANFIGLPLDQINFVACQVTALFLAFAYRKYVPARTTGASVRHLCALIIGISLGIFCFGRQVWHLFAQAGGCYVLMKLAPAAAMHIWVFAFAMVYLSVIHIYRVVYDYGCYTLDVTGPLMISSQKLTSLAFSIHDGLYKKEDKLSKDQKYHAVKNIPNPLAFLSYIFYFQGLLAGPLCFFNDYIAFVEGKNFPYDKPIIIEVNGKKQASPVGEPNPKAAVIKKLIASFVSMVVSLWFCPIWPKVGNADKKFIATYNFLYRILFLLVSVALSRARYYFAWKLAEATNNASGLGFNGWDETGRERWDLVNNVKIRQLETSTGLKGLIDNWNIQTSLWLRRICYDRAGKQKMLLTYVLSAVWHGFYPGYYMSFISATFTTMAARTWRKNIRPYFLHNKALKLGYDLFTWLMAQLALAYLIVPFSVLELGPILFFYHYSMYWFLHVGTFLILILLPRNGPKKFRDSTATKTEGDKSSVSNNPNAVTSFMLAQQLSAEKEEPSSPGGVTAVSEEDNHKKLAEENIEKREKLLSENKKDL